MRKRTFLKGMVGVAGIGLSLAGCSGGRDNPENSTETASTETASDTGSTPSSKISWTKASGLTGPPKAGRVETRTRELVDYLNKEIDNHEFKQKSYGNCGINSRDGYKPTPQGERKFTNDVLETLDDGEGLEQGEVVAIAHQRDEWGFGRSNKFLDIGGKTVWGCLVNASGLVHGWETDGFTWHEIGHALGCTHCNGSIALDSNGDMHHITPMCMAYVRNENGVFDTRRVPDLGLSKDISVDRFHKRSGGTIRPERHGFKHGSRMANHDLDRYSEASLKEIANWVNRYPTDIQKGFIDYTLRVTESDGTQIGSVTVRDSHKLRNYGSHIMFGTIGDFRGDGDQGIADFLRLESGEHIESWSIRDLNDYTRTQSGGGKFKIVSKPTADGSSALAMFTGQNTTKYTSKKELFSLDIGQTVQCDLRHQTDKSSTYAMMTHFMVGAGPDGKGGVMASLINPGTERTPGVRLRTPNAEGRVEFEPTTEKFYTLSIDIGCKTT